MNLTRSSVKPPTVAVSHSSGQRSAGLRRRSAPGSEVHAVPVISRVNEPAVTAPSLASGDDASADNPFASLEQETTRAFQVSNELLEMARENAAVANGATRAYEVPAELLEMARRKKLARAAASLKPAAAPSGPDAEAVKSEGEAEEVTQTGPRLAFSELSDEDRAWVESALVPAPKPDPSPRLESSPKSKPAPPADTVEQSQVRAVQLPHVAPKKSKNNSARWLLISLCVVAISAVAIQYARLSSDLQLPWSLGWDNDISLGQLLSAPGERGGGESR